MLFGVYLALMAWGGPTCATSAFAPLSPSADEKADDLRLRAGEKGANETPASLAAWPSVSMAIPSVNHLKGCV